MSSKPVAVVTGTSSGFGYHTAERLAEAGYTVFGTMRDPRGRNEKARAALIALGVTVLDVDVTDQASVDRGAREVLGAVDRLDVLVNNAGTAHFGLLEAFTPESMERQFATNVVGPHRINRAFLPTMRAAKTGLVVFVSSVVGRFTLPFGGVYASSKWAVEAQAEALSYELRPLGIDVAIVEPGAYATNILNVVITPDDSARADAYGPEIAQLSTGMTSGLTQGADGTDPRDISNAIERLAAMAPGTRPLRTTVPGGGPADAINAAVEPIQRAVLEGFGMSTLLQKNVVSV